ncbi:MAG: nucleotide exchange factor GrpE [Oculatellaceae cyanobacterium bins.114]|nr:nucleotide exchange factor GrpE [Oculatellaceae cyanobacterium bins.114]
MFDRKKQLENTQESESMPKDSGVSQDTEDKATSVEPGLIDEPTLDVEPSVSPEMVTDEALDDEGAEPIFDAADTTSELPPQNEYQITIDELTKQVESLKAHVDERTGQCMRMAADFDNFRKRTQKEKEDLEQQVKCSTVIELLPVVDNFERARLQIKPQTESEMTIHKSYQGVYKDLVDRLKRIGVAPMRAEGKEFDPNLHEAVMREPTEEFAEGTVMEELVRGYLLGERVLRHAMVKVAAPPEEVTTEETHSNDTEG